MIRLPGKVFSRPQKNSCPFPLPKKWRPAAEEAARLAKTLRPLVKNHVEYSADFLVTPGGQVLFIEGGPAPEFGADPCLLDPTRPFGNGEIAL